MYFNKLQNTLDKFSELAPGEIGVELQLMC